MNRSRRLLFRSALLCALLLALALASTAAAETKVAEGTSPANAALSGEGDVLKAAASYDLATGSFKFDITTRLAPESVPAEERPTIEYLGAFLSPTFPCSKEVLEAEEKKAEEEERSASAFPALEGITFNEPITSPPPGAPPAEAYWAYLTHEPEMGVSPNYVPASKSVSGTTTTISATSTVPNQPYSCLEIGAVDTESSAEPDILVLPLTTKPEPPAPVVTPPAQPAPGAFSLTKAKKALRLQVGKWKAVKVKVTNTGGTTTDPGTLRLKGTKGVVVKGARGKLPVLLPGGTWTVSYKVKLTPKAKSKSTLPLIGQAGSVSLTSSLVVKRVGSR